jgi:hypothetical protein
MMEKREKIIDDLTHDTIWMSMRFWLANDETIYSFIKDYPTKMVARFWAKLDHMGRSKLVDDVGREIDCSLYETSKIRAEYMWDVLMGKTKAPIEKYMQAMDFSDDDDDDDDETILFQSYYKYDNDEMDYEILDEFDFTMLRMAILYSCNRMTIASATLPLNIIKNRYNLLNDEQINTILCDLNGYLDWHEKTFKNGRKFSSSNYDDNIWKKFMSFLDKTTHFDILASDEKTYQTFLHDNLYHSINNYIGNPYIDTYIEPTNGNIVKITKSDDNKEGKN